jgi:MraZ protein
MRIYGIDKEKYVVYTFQLEWNKVEGSGVFYGEYSHTLDKKGRLIIPSRFRDVIKEMCIEKMYITRGLDECLFMFSESEWKAQESKFKSLSFTKKEVRKFKRLFFSGAVEVVPDKQWRILIPEYLKGYAKLSRQIMIVGVSNRVEIWDKKKWNDFYGSTKQEYEEIAERLMETE